jgi:hypothetical protein
MLSSQQLDRLHVDTVWHDLQSEKPTRLTASGYVNDRDEDNETFHISIFQTISAITDLSPMNIKTKIELWGPPPFPSPHIPYIGSVVMFTALLVNVENGVVIVMDEDHSPFQQERHYSEETVHNDTWESAR